MHSSTERCGRNTPNGRRDVDVPQTLASGPLSPRHDRALIVLIARNHHNRYSRRICAPHKLPLRQLASPSAQQEAEQAIREGMQSEDVIEVQMPWGS